jgi:polysaccharide biosynthesis transport protein
MNDSPTLPGRGIQPLTSLLKHGKLALTVFVLVFLLGIPVAWKKGQPFYQTEATIQVSPRFMRNLKEDQELDFQSNTQYRQFVEHQRRSIGRYDVLRDALDGMGEQRSLWQKPNETERRAIERLRSSLQISSVPDTYLIRIALRAESPEGLAEVINAVTATFIERMKAEQIFGADDRVQQLRERENSLLSEITSKGNERSEIAQSLGLTTFNEATPNPFDQLMADLRGNLADARQRRMDADAALSAFKARGDTTVGVRSVQDAVLNDPGLNSLKASLSQRRAALLIQKSGLKSDHPGAIAAVRELAEIEVEMSNQGSRLDTGVRSNLLARLQGTADQAREVERGLQQEVVQAEARASQFARLFQDAMSITADMGQHRSELDRVRERINFLEIESGSLGFLRLVNPALIPDMPIGGGRRKLLLMVLIAALGAALVAPVLRDLVDRRVHTVNDAQKLMGISPAGWQVERADHASQVFAVEQLRRMAAALIRSQKVRGQHVFGFSACKPGAGTTSLVIELALTLRQLGYRVLMVEANGYSRDDRFATDSPGLINLLQDQAGPDEVIITGDSSLPDRVAIARSSEQGRIGIERLDRFKLALEYWAGSADFVLIDMPPLLTSSDAELLVPLVGNVLLVVEAGNTTRGELQRSQRLLKTIDPEAVGMVVNRVEPFTAGGYLRDLMLESISGRHAEKVYSLPRWKLLAFSFWTRMRLSRA